MYFDSSPQPTATPTAIHQTPRPVCQTLARKYRTKADATISGASGVTMVVPTDAINVALRKIVADTAIRASLNKIPAVRYTAQLIGSASRIETIRTPNAVSPAIIVPRRITTATIDGWS